jgi:hypothetical protein
MFSPKAASNALSIDNIDFDQLRKQNLPDRRSDKPSDKTKCKIASSGRLSKHLCNQHQLHVVVPFILNLHTLSSQKKTPMF